MRTVEEIESSIEQLSHSQLLQLSRWLDEHLEKIWDARMEIDAKAGKLTHYKTEIARSRVSGELIDFP